MYQILCDNFVLHDTRVDDLQVIGAKCDLEVNKTGSLTFSILQTHPHYDDIVKHKSIIRLIHNDKLVFVGRVLNDDIDFNNIKNVECEGELSFLLDSIQRAKEYHLDGGSENVIKSYLQDLINNHNTQVDDYKKFTVGNVTVADSNNYLYKISNYETTLDVITDKLLNSYGGYILTRHSGNTTYIDYVSEYSGVCSQKIEFGKNIVDMTRYIKGEDIFTAIIPLGAIQEGTVAETIPKRLTIDSVPNITSGTIVKHGDYVYDSEAVNRWGWIWKTYTWDDVTIANNLYASAKKLLQNSIDETFTMELTAIDLSLLDVNIDSIELGNKIQCVSVPHGINELMFVESISIDVDNPSNTKIKLCLPEGNKVVAHSLTKSKNDADKKSDEIKSSVDDVKKLLDEDYPTNGDIDYKLNSTVNDLKNWVDDNYCSKDVNGNIDLSRYALIDDVNRAFSELASALSGV